MTKVTEVLAIVNPAAGGGRSGSLAPAALDRLRAEGIALDQVSTSGPGDATRLAREAYASGVRWFIAVGGDGTGYEIVNGLLPAALGAGASARPCVGFLPLGTGNSFLRDFGSGDAAHALDALRERRRKPCDVVRLSHDSGELYYINLLSVGFVADVAACANRRFKRLGPAGYGLGVVARTASLAPRPWHMQMDDSAWHEPVLFASFCNSRFTGGRMMMAPFADPADGQLDVIIASRMGRFALLTAFPRIFAGTHVHLPTIACSRARHVRIDADEAIDLMIDGEVVRHRPQGLEVLAGAIDVCV
jgi:YegS/Rv2252/BmrU family lipid kinase